MTPLDPNGIKAPGATMSGMAEQQTVQWVFSDNPPPVQMPGRAPRLLPGQIVDYDDVTYEVVSRTEHQGGRISYDLRALPERVPGAIKWSPLGGAA